RRTAVFHEEVEQLVRARFPAQAYEGADGTQLVGGVGLPVRRAPPPHEFLPVTLEGVLQRRLRQVGQLAAGTDGDRGRGSVEVREVRGAGDVVDAGLGDRSIER